MSDAEKPEMPRPRFVTGGNFTVHVVGNEGVLELYVLDGGGGDLDRLIDRKDGLHIFTRYYKPESSNEETDDINP